jgi:hypothetical protein
MGDVSQLGLRSSTKFTSSSRPGRSVAIDASPTPRNSDFEKFFKKPR